MRYCPYCMREIEGSWCPDCQKDVETASNGTNLAIGTILDTHYVIGICLGAGGFGVTYAALNCASGERVAIKEYFPIYWSERSDNGRDILPKSAYTRTYQSGREKFLHEAEMIQRVRHLKSIVKVKDFFQANNTAYIVMEYLEGKTLKQLVKSILFSA